MDNSNLQQIKEENDNLKSELTKRENNFSEKRAQFKELYIKKEQELSKAKHKIIEITSELQKVKNELLDIQSAAALAESIRQEELESMKETYKKEISSINGIMKDNIDSINKAKQDLETKIEKLESEKLDLIRRLDEKSNELVNTNENVLVKIAQRLKLNTHEIFKGFQDNADETSDNNLSRAQNDAEILKSVVEPYEEDVKLLKSKIRDAYEKIDQLEATITQTKSTDIEELHKQIIDLKHQLNLEMDNNNYLRQTLSLINDKYFETESKLLRNEKLMTQSQKMQMKSIFEPVKIENQDGDQITKNIENHVDLTKLTLRKSLSGNDLKLSDDFDNIPPPNIARRNTDVQSLNEFCAHSLSSPTQKTRVISENEWSRMQLELSSLKTRSSNSCEMCKNYEDQLQAIQNKFKEKETAFHELEAEKETHLKSIVSLQESSDKMSSCITSDIAIHEKSIANLSEKLNNLNDFCDRLRSAYERFRESTDKELKQIHSERRELKLKLEKIELTYDNLLCKRLKTAMEMEAEPIELPSDMEAAQFCLLKLKEDLIQCRAANEHLNDSLQSNEIFNKEKAKAEKAEKDALINEYNNEKKDLETQLEQLQLELNKRKLVTKSSENLEETILVLKTELETVKKNYLNLEHENKILKSKSQALQHELENSESVQQDFVRLSQTLQIQLEKIRQEEKELRWQFKDDVMNCNDCQSDFSSTNDRKKYHCRHCGRIFCKPCLLELSLCSNSKKADVCKVCHTLLVKEAVPYFSNSKS